MAFREVFSCRTGRTKLVWVSDPTIDDIISAGDGARQTYSMKRPEKPDDPSTQQPVADTSSNAPVGGQPILSEGLEGVDSPRSEGPVAQADDGLVEP